jgi:hypothetical protein
MLTLEQRFATKYIQASCGCWIWTSFELRDGYGGFGVRGRPVLAHRFSWKLHKGEIPNGQCVLHHCDVPLCVNPDHLFLGTQQDNIRDKVAKHRQATGERHGMAKLTDVQVAEILGMKGQEKAKTVAARYGVTPERIWQLWGTQ